MFAPQGSVCLPHLKLVQPISNQPASSSRQVRVNATFNYAAGFGGNIFVKRKSMRNLREMT